MNKNPNFETGLIVVGDEDFSSPLNYGRTKQQTIDATRNMIENTLPDVSAVPQDGELTVIAYVEIEFERVFVQKYQKVSKESLVNLIQNPLLDGLKALNLASLQA